MVWRPSRFRSRFRLNRTEVKHRMTSGRLNIRSFCHIVNTVTLTTELHDVFYCYTTLHT